MEGNWYREVMINGVYVTKEYYSYLGLRKPSYRSKNHSNQA
jgi:hypothetical protein